VVVSAPPQDLPADIQRFIDQPLWTIDTDAHGRPVVDDNGALVTRPVT
jgi:hypothetical protein